MQQQAREMEGRHWQVPAVGGDPAGTNVAPLLANFPPVYKAW